MGGRMLDIDPILTADGEHLILTYNTSIQIFSATDSLLVRRISLDNLDGSASRGIKPAPIVATRLSKQDDNFLWVACANGRIYRFDWTIESRKLSSFQTESKTARAITLVPFGGNKSFNEVVIVAESYETTRTDIVAYQWDSISNVTCTSLVSIERHGSGLQLLESSKDGHYLVGALNDRLFLAVSRRLPAKSDQLQYDFFSFDTPDLITALDLRVYKRSQKHSISEKVKILDVIVGGARGGIYLYHDAIARCQASKVGGKDNTLLAQKYHWHRKSVHSVKWSKDGNYMISGGSENTLVIWQMDTSKKEFLPHLSGSVENITVSADGSAYVIHLDDNSSMVLSTAELKPTAYVSGLQSASSAEFQTSKDQLVKRVWEVEQNVLQSIPAAIRSSAPSRLHICVGSGRQSITSGRYSAPLLQTFDLETFTNISKQALARTHLTDVNMTSKGQAIDEPMVTHVEFSSDGKWLASVDDWQPASRDFDNVNPQFKDQLVRERREVYLKFWEMQDENEPAVLVSRINGPHTTSSSEPVLDLAADPSSTCFATLGGDGLVRLWCPKKRHTHGIVARGASGKETVSWGCAQVIPVGEQYGHGVLTDAMGVSACQGKLTYSEDGSTIFAAFGSSDTGSVSVIDAASGTVVRTLEGLWEGKLHAICALSPFVVVLSNVLDVYDIVSDELRYGIVVPQAPGVEDLLQLTADHTSGHFAVTLPIGEVSSIGIFCPQDPEPLMVRSTTHRVVSMATAPGTGGFIALDDAAQIWTITEGSDPSSIMTAQPLQDIHLDGKVEDATVNVDESFAVATNGGDDALMASDDEKDVDGAVAPEGNDTDVDMDDVLPASVIPQQSLADIFNAAPAFAGPSVEDLFYKVTGLLCSKPLHH